MLIRIKQNLNSTSPQQFQQSNQISHNFTYLINYFRDIFIFIIMQPSHLNEGESFHQPQQSEQLLIERSFQQPRYPQMHWTTAYIDGKFYVAHPLDLDKLIKLEQQIKLQKNKLKLPENPHRQQDNGSIKSYNIKKRPQSSLSRDCKTEINETKELKVKIQAEKELVQEEQKYKQKLEQFKKNRKNKREWLNQVHKPDDHKQPADQTKKQQKSSIHQSNVEKKKSEVEYSNVSQKQKNSSIKQKNSSRKSSKKDSFKGQMVAPHQLKRDCSQKNEIKEGTKEEAKEVYEKKQENNYISFKPEEKEISPRFEMDSKKSKKKSEISKKSFQEMREKSQKQKSNKSFVISYRKTPSHSQENKSLNRSNLKSASSISSKIQLEELNQKIKNMQSKLDQVQKRQTQIEIFEKSRMQQFSHLDPHESQVKNQPSQVQKSGKLEKKQKSEGQSLRESEKRESQGKRDTIHDLVGMNNERGRRLNLSSSIVNYNLNQEVLKSKLLQSEEDEKERMKREIIELKKTIRQLKLERIKHESIIEEFDKIKVKQNENSRVQRYHQEKEQSIVSSQKEDLDPFKKKTIEREDTEELPKKQTIKSLRLNPQNKNFRISKEKSQKSSKGSRVVEGQTYRQFQPSSLTKKGIIVRQIFNSSSVDQGSLKSSSFQARHDKMHGLNPQSPKSSGKKVFELQFVKEREPERIDTIESEEEVKSVPQIDIEPFPIPQIPEAPKSDISQGDLLKLAKEICAIYGIEVVKDDSLYMKKYKNCIIFKTPEVRKTIVWHYSGKFYIGGWEQTEGGEGKKNGDGFQFIPDKYYYKGQFLDGKKNGSGTQININGNIYQGQWVKGEKCGQGIFYDKSLNQYYDGEWKENKKDGKGLLKMSECQFYDGTFSKNIKDGYGYEIFGNGDKYRGEYKFGRFHGRGKYNWANGSYYDGNFSEGHREGQGKWKSAKRGGDVYVGQYKKDKKSGRGRYEWHNGCKYEGNFLEDLKHGQGRVTYADGREVKGRWQKGKLVEIDKKIREQQEEVREQVWKGSGGKVVQTPSKQLQSSKLLYRI